MSLKYLRNWNILIVTVKLSKKCAGWFLLSIWFNQEAPSTEEPPWSDWLVGVCVGILYMFTHAWGMSPLWGNIPRQVSLVSIRKPEEQKSESKPAIKVPPWSLLQLLLPGSWLEVPHWWTIFWRRKSTFPSPSYCCSWCSPNNRKQASSENFLSGKMSIPLEEKLYTDSYNAIIYNINICIYT